jgi:ligand-binding sensor domain-containing protein
MLIDQNGDLWTGGSGGVVHWDIGTGDYIKYTVENGLASNYVRSIAQSPDGTLWFGTCWGGVSRFDGSNWTTYNTQDGLLQNCVLSITATPDGAMWFGSYMGVTRYDGQNWHTYSAEITGDPVKRADVMAVAPDGSLWIRGDLDCGLLRYDGNKWQDYSNFLTNSSVTALAFAHNGTLWVGTGQTLSSFQDGVWETIALQNDRDFEKRTSISSIAILPDDSMWVGFFFETKSQTANIEREQVGVRDDLFSGVLHFDGGKWRVFNTEDGLTENEILAINVGKDGSIWFGSYKQGVSKYNGSEWETFRTQDDIPSNSIDHLDVTMDGILWISHPEGVSSFDGQRWTTYSQIGELPDCDNFLYIGQDNSIWCGSFYGVAQLINGNWTTYSSTLYEGLEGVTTMTSMPTGTYLFGSLITGEVWQYNGDSWTLFPYTGDSDITNLLALPDGNLWFGTLIHGIYTYDGSIWRHYTISSGLIGNSVTALAVSRDGTIWLGTFTGASSFNGGKWTNYSQEDGLIGEVKNIVIDSKGIVWIATDKGLNRFDSKKWDLFTTANGMANNYISDMAIDFDGTIWVATNSGVSRYIPSEP